MRTENHYQWLEKHLPDFFKGAGINWENHQGIIRAHRDKAYGYQGSWEDVGIPFTHGVAIYLLSYCNPFDKEVRETKGGWISPCEWVINNYQRFQHILLDIEKI